ncbi:MAG: hypothetical protein M3487_03695 [Actinomycetota bacterium]|nr:hypothetical protein [Acidimicrobiia bacterium]MDQ3468864.1 hypothetical protein [Actinomycetota bacterium]
MLLHGADHVRRGAASVDRDVFWVGVTAIALEVGVVVLACRRHRLAPLVAAATGWSLAAGYVLVHFLPARGWLSDSFVSADDVSPLSWIAASVEVVAAVGLGAIGLTVLRRRGGVESALRPYPQQRPPRRGFTHPVALVMIVGNAVILAATAAS